MTKRGRGVLLHDDKEPKVQGYLILGNDHYQIVGTKMSKIRTVIEVHHVGEKEPKQRDLFEERER